MTLIKQFAVLGMACTMALSPVVSAKEKEINLKISLWTPTTHPLYEIMTEWAASVEKESNGSITSTMYPSQQLGKAFDHYDMARDGIADVTHVLPGYQPGRFPIISLADIPFTIKGAKNGSMALDEWYRSHALKEMKDVRVCMAFIHAPGTFHSRRKKIVVPEDISGLKIRPANGTIGTLIASLGGTNIQAPAIEARDILEKGVADAITFPWGSSVLYGIEQVTKYHMKAPLYVSAFVFAFNKNKYNRMSDKQKQVIDNHCNTEWAGRVGQHWGDAEDGGISKIEAMADQDVYTLTEEQMASWRKATQPLHASWAKGAQKAGAIPDKLAAEFKVVLEKYDAAVN